jgi:hypothetical protein
MAFIVIEVEVPAKAEGQLNALLRTDSYAGVQELVNLLEGVSGGTTDGQVIVAVRATTSTPTSSGSGATAVTYNLK